MDAHMGNWLLELQRLKEDDKWREHLHVDDEDEGVLDPWGSPAVLEAIAVSMEGPSQSVCRFPIEMNLHQASFFLHVMELAMDGKGFVPAMMKQHKMQIEELGIKIQNTWARAMTKIHIIDLD